MDNRGFLGISLQIAISLEEIKANEGQWESLVDIYVLHAREALMDELSAYGKVYLSLHESSIKAEETAQ